VVFRFLKNFLNQVNQYKLEDADENFGHSG